MVFTSLEYVIFLPLLMLMLYSVPQKYKNHVLLLTSLFFYLNFAFESGIVLFLIIVITYLLIIMIVKQKSKSKKKLCIAVLLALTSGILVYIYNKNAIYIGTIFSYLGQVFKQGGLLFITIVITYLSAIMIEDKKEAFQKKFFLIVSLVLNFGILVYFKYFNFILKTGIDIANSISGKENLVFLPLKIILPVGISFYIFQALGYVIDVYRKKIKAERNLGKYILFVSFFPPISSGPIARAPHLLKEFEKEYKFDSVNVLSGAILIFWGLFKKMVIADRAAVLVNTVYNDVGSYKGIPLFIATVAFAVQLYCDFSGYSDIAIGSAQVLNINLMRNFDAPYFSTSVSEFWRKWHISLSSWFKDYLYIPLGGNRKGVFRKYINIIIVFLVSGLWHGAAMNYIIWGLLNGLYQVIGEITLGLRQKITDILKIDRQSVTHKGFQMLITFGLICISYIFFRANTLSDSLYVLKNVFYPNLWQLTDGTLLKLGLNMQDFVLLAICIFVLILVDLNYKKFDIRKKIINQPIIYRWGIYIVLIMSVLIFGIYGTSQGSENFLYFQF